MNINRIERSHDSNTENFATTTSKKLLLGKRYNTKPH